MRHPAMLEMSFAAISFSAWVVGYNLSTSHSRCAFPAALRVLRNQHLHQSRFASLPWTDNQAYLFLLKMFNQL
ncbi:hypothetical protein N9219_01360 [bacterium]|nr:hypothetical protein [bacterium]